jgi:hypothetical protein
MEFLRQQKELERVERERTLWRDASKPPKVMEVDGATTPQETTPEQNTEARPLMGLFSKLRLGKFLE